MRAVQPEHSALCLHVVPAAAPHRATPHPHTPPFGKVQSAHSALELDNVPYGRNGSFAVSLWMRRLPGSDSSGVTFGYLFSHSGVAATSGASPNEVRGLAAHILVASLP